MGERYRRRTLCTRLGMGGILAAMAFALAIIAHFANFPLDWGFLLNYVYLDIDDVRNHS